MTLHKSTKRPTGCANLFTLDFGKLLNWVKDKGERDHPANIKTVCT